MTPLVREASHSDLEILAHLHAVCFESPWGIDAFRKFLQSERAFVLLAGEENNAAAFILVQVAADECEILSLATLPSARRRGLARSLVLSAAERAEQSGARKFFLEVAADNEAALALYAVLGFSPAGRRFQYYERPRGPAVDAVILRAPLPLPAANPGTAAHSPN